MSSRYKEYFKGVNMKEGLVASKEEDVSEYEESVNEKDEKVENTTAIKKPEEEEQN